MPAPQGYVALDLVGFTDKGDYAAGTTYAQNDLVHSDNRIYLSLQDNNVGQALPVSPDTETEFWKLWLSGGGDDLEALTAEDTSNVTGGGAGQVVVAQTLIDAIANKVMNDLVAKSQIINNLLATQAGNVLDATQGKALKDEIDQLNSDLQDHYSLLIPETLIPNGSDLNDYTTPGQYYVSTAANSKTIENCPYTLSGFKLTVEKMSSDGHILQTLKAVNEKYIYYRTAANSNFNGWLTPVTNADISYGNLGAGNFGAVEGRWQKFGQIVTFAGLIRSISGASGNWGTLATTPYTALSSIWFRPLLNTTGNEPVVRDGNINGSNIESWLNSEDNGKYIFFSGTYVCNN